MSISDRYREIVEDILTLTRQLRQEGGDEAGAEARLADQAAQGLESLREGVGEIPRIRLESQLTPVLLKAHSQLDRVRLLLEEQGGEDRAAEVWELEQKIYRLLNDL